MFAFVCVNLAQCAEDDVILVDLGWPSTFPCKHHRIHRAMPNTFSKERQTLMRQLCSHSDQETG